MKPADFCAILLAGGRSTRMGKDKAALLVEGEPLWQRQLDLLRESGAAEIAVAGRNDGPYAGQVTILEDEYPGLGPLSGIVSGLRWNSALLLLVLAVDLPRMNATFLKQLAALAKPGCGVVPTTEQGFEPLAAVLPDVCLPLAEQHLRGSDRSMQRFVSDCVNAGFVCTHPLSAQELPLFTNVNTPEDWDAWNL